MGDACDMICCDTLSNARVEWMLEDGDDDDDDDGHKQQMKFCILYCHKHKW